jgi:TetR/AcrR family transcriptional regulator, transcriptional repressor for nem operon
MKVSKDEAAANRERILTEAARLFRERGLSGVGVDALTEAAGLTHGSLYSRFGSKEILAAEAVTHAFAGTAKKWGGVESLGKYADAYLSAAHRDSPGDGCTVSALGCEIPRQGKAVRRSFTEGVRRSMARIAALMPPGRQQRREAEALAFIATLLGTLILARAVDDSEFSDRILAAGRAQLAKGN